MKMPEGNGLGAEAVLEVESEEHPAHTEQPVVQRSESARAPYVPEKGERRASLRDHARVLVIGAGIALVLVLLAIAGIPHQPLSVAQKRAANRPGQPLKTPDIGATAPASILPLLDSGRRPNEATDPGMVHPDEIARTASQRPQPPLRSSLGSIPPFENPETWAPAPYRGQPPTDPAGQGTAARDEVAAAKNQHEILDRASLVFVRNHAAVAAPRVQENSRGIEPTITLAPGTRLLARLESSVSTADQAPVVAVIEYNYEQNGEIILPAGSKAFGHLQAADRSGYVAVRFDSLMMPDGSETSLEASATDLDLRPLKGEVEGKHARTNIVVRSLAGVGQMAAALAGRGSLNQPLSESDLLREKLGNNIAQTSDQEVAKLAVTEHLVVSLAAGTEIYVVLAKPAKHPVHSGTGPQAALPPTSGQPNFEELRQLLRLQGELNPPVTSKTVPDQKRTEPNPEDR